MELLRGRLDSVIEFEANRVVRQRTLKQTIHCRGIGLHSGTSVRLTLRPADPDTGVRFVRVDRPGQPAIPALWDRVVDTRLCTVLGLDDGTTVGTVEHLMAAVSAAAIDNLIIEIDGPEVPAMDGSAAPFVFLIECAGIAEQDPPKRAIRVHHPVSVAHGHWSASLAPGRGFVVGCEIRFDNPVIAEQAIEVCPTDGGFKRELARARTFGFRRDLDQLRAAGLGRGGSLRNAVVIDGDRVLNDEGFRFADECVRHKALDAIGDLSLAGAPIIGHFRGVCSGHTANNMLLRALFADPKAWSWDVLRVGDREGAQSGWRRTPAAATAGA